MTDHLGRAKRIVVKVGSALLVDTASGAVKSDWLATLANRISPRPMPYRREAPSRP